MQTLLKRLGRILIVIVFILSQPIGTGSILYATEDFSRSIDGHYIPTVPFVPAEEEVESEPEPAQELVPSPAHDDSDNDGVSDQGDNDPDSYDILSGAPPGADETLVGDGDSPCPSGDPIPNPDGISTGYVCP